MLNAYPALENQAGFLRDSSEPRTDGVHSLNDGRTPFQALRLRLPGRRRQQRLRVSLRRGPQHESPAPPVERSSVGVRSRVGGHRISELLLLSGTVQTAGPPKLASTARLEIVSAEEAIPRMPAFCCVFERFSATSSTLCSFKQEYVTDHSSTQRGASVCPSQPERVLFKRIWLDSFECCAEYSLALSHALVRLITTQA